MSEPNPTKQYTINPQQQAEENILRLVAYAIDKDSSDGLTLDLSTLEVLSEESSSLDDLEEISASSLNEAKVPNTKIKVKSTLEDQKDFYFKYHRLHLDKQIEVLVKDDPNFFTFEVDNHHDLVSAEVVFNKLVSKGLKIPNLLTCAVKRGESDQYVTVETKETNNLIYTSGYYDHDLTVTVKETSAEEPPYSPEEDPTPSEEEPERSPPTEELLYSGPLYNNNPYTERYIDHEKIRNKELEGAYDPSQPDRTLLD